MGIGAKISAAVAAGYLLGRWHKLRLAMLAAGVLAGKKIPTDPQHLLRQALAFVESNEELAEVSSQVKGQLLAAARDAALKVATDQVGSLTQNLQNRSGGDAPDDGDAQDADDELDDEPHDIDETETDSSEADDQSDDPKPRDRRSSSGSKSSDRSRGRSSSRSRAGNGSRRSPRRSSAKA